MPKATLINHTPLTVASNAIRTCWQSFDKSDSTEEKVGERDKELIHRVGNQYRHASTLEHLYYTFYITCSRAVLQELARHRMASLSVKSTRYTLKELKSEDVFRDDDFERVSKYIILTENEQVNKYLIKSLNILLEVVKSGVGNDIAKYALPECYKTELTWSINARSLQNFLELRTSKKALWEIRELALDIYNALPSEHTYLFDEFVDGKTDNGG